MKTNEVFLSVPGYEGLYEVSNLGNIKSLRSGKLLKQASDNVGYKLVCLTKDGKSKGYGVHRLVALAFLPNPENLPEVNHKDETHDNNCVENLEWCTKSYNRNYGTYRERMSKSIKALGTRNNKSISAYDKTTKKFIKSYDSIQDAEKELKLSKGTISKALTGKTKTSAGFVWKYNRHFTMADLENTSSTIDLTPSEETKFFEDRTRWFEEVSLM